MSISLKTAGQGSIEAWFPRGLVCNGADILSAPVTKEGLSPLRISWERGRVRNIEFVEYPDHPITKLLLPRLVEPHAHIDKGFTWEKFPNLGGTYEGALEANMREHKLRTPESVRLRAEKALQRALKNGLRAIRTHIDSFGSIGNQSWDVLNELKIEWQDLIELQCVALVPLEYWSSTEGSLLARKVANQDGLLGGILVPPFNRNQVRSDLLNLIRLANSLGCAIDLHIDEASKSPAEGLKHLIRVLDCIACNVPITCSHSSSMALLSNREIKHLANRLANHNVSVIALPLTNAWLLGRHTRRTPVVRPLAPIKQLQQAGISVAVGGDNVQDPWFPLGNLDPISLISSSMPITQLAPWERLGLSAYTTSAAVIMGLEWDGSLKRDAPADFIVIEAKNWSEAISATLGRQKIVNGNWLHDDSLSVKEDS